MPKNRLMGSKKNKDTYRDPAMKAKDNPSKGHKTKEGPMFKKGNKRGR